MSFILSLFSSTKLEKKRAEEVLPGNGGLKGMEGGQGCGTMYTM
jgi:hypothetical protein